MDNSHSAFRDISPRKPRLWPPAPPESHSCKFCQSLQAQCLSEPGINGYLKFNVTARDVLRNIEHECYCDFGALMACIWKTKSPRRTPSCGDISTDVLFPTSGSDRIPDEIVLVYMTLFSSSARDGGRRILAPGFRTILHLSTALGSGMR